MGEQVEAVAKNAFILGEGPVWDERSQSLYLVDLLKGDVCRYDPVTTDVSRAHVGDGTASIILPREKGGFVVSNNGNIATMESWENPTVKIIATVYDDKHMKLNDGKIDAAGRLWIGSYYFEDDPAKRDPSNWPDGRGSLYCMNTDGKVEKKLSNITVSNGMDWTSDNRIMYYIDSKPRKVLAFDFNVEEGTISNQRTVADFSGTDVADLGYPDGMTVDVEGKLWVACAKGSKVVRIDETTGKVIRTIQLPVEFVASCCFGGEDYSDLYVTTGICAQPLHGTIFKVTGLGVKGKKSNLFMG